MVVVNYTTARNKLKEFCDLAFNNKETVIITRKADQNVVILSLDRYNEMVREIKNAQYLEKIDRGLEQLHSGRGQVHDLIED